MFRKRRFRSAAMQLVQAFNAHDPSSVAAAITPDCRFIDSAGEVIEGKNACEKATEVFMKMEPRFAITVENASVYGNEVLMSGSTKADNPLIAKDQMWRARIINGKVGEWQSFGNGEPISVAQALRVRMQERERAAI